MLKLKVVYGFHICEVFVSVSLPSVFVALWTAG